jgi:predicted nuclease of predicted toxin-antitoxin system
VHRFLIDECCSPSLASVAHQRGFEATHVGYLDRLGYPDQAHVIRATAENWILVTNNGADFRPMYRTLELHCGLAIILPSVRRDRQRELFAAVLDQLETMPDAVNKLIEVDAEALVSVTDWPPVGGNQE